MKKHSHYYKDVSHLEEIDVYRICELFEVEDPSGALQHAIKKLLVAGGRGAGKDLRKDIQEAVDTLKRKLDNARWRACPRTWDALHCAGRNSARTASNSSSEPVLLCARPLRLLA